VVDPLVPADQAPQEGDAAKRYPPKEWAIEGLKAWLAQAGDAQTAKGYDDWIEASDGEERPEVYGGRWLSSTAIRLLCDSENGDGFQQAVDAAQE
jgi:hypothetical protein